MAFKLGMAVDLCMDAHAHFDDLDLDASRLAEEKIQL